ncbi:MAG: sugar transferase [Bryobacteraceae bacterium]
MAGSRSNKESDFPTPESSSLEVLPQESFLRMLHLEQKRTERSRRRFVLMLLESASLLTDHNEEGVFERILSALSQSTRETDITGWYENGAVIGIIFTEIGDAEGKSVASALLTKVSAALSGTLAIEHINQISLSFHVFPEEWHERGSGRSSVAALYTNSLNGRGPKKVSSALKRSLDIIGSLLALLLLSPVLLVIALVVKMTSNGPILFRQRRVGQFGQTFTFLKFRSMCSGNNHAVHEEYIKSLILGTNKSDQPQGQRQVYKLTNDARVTPVGKFLRRTSLDELPQFFNVLKGDMSLVGPRPPIPYEVRHYDIWHRRRFLTVKPGITGLWQVKGRSRVGFDDMVRMDLQYARSWSLWLDIKILLQTPGAVFGGYGAY